MGSVVLDIWKDNFSTVSDSMAEERTEQVGIVDYSGVTSRNMISPHFLAL